MKKILALALAVVMVMSVLAGCGSKPAPETTAPAATVPATTAPATTEDEFVEITGSWSDTAVQIGEVSTPVYVLDVNLVNCVEVTVFLDITMNAGTHCEDWVLYGRVNGKMEEICDFTLPGGDGSTGITVTFDQPVSFDALTATPTVPGGYSWTLDMVVGDAYVLQ